MLLPMAIAMPIVIAYCLLVLVMFWILF